MSMGDEDSVQVTDLNDWIKTTMAPYVVHGAASLSCVLIFVWTLHWHGSLSFSSPDLFNFHPLLNSLAFILIVPESILLMRFSGFRRQVSKPFHAGLHSLGLLFSILAVTSAFKYNHDNKFAHARSLHSWLGIATLTFFIAQWLFGAFLFYRARGSVRAKFKPFHVHTGLTIVFLSSVTLATGLMERTIFAGSCSSGVSRECLVANGAVLTAVISFIALGTALTATSTNRYRRVSLDDPLLPSRAPGAVSVDEPPVQIDA